MDKLQKEALQVTKELVVKFIEAGRVSPSNLGEVFSQTYTVVLQTIAQDTPEGCGKSDRQDNGQDNGQYKPESSKSHGKSQGKGHKDHS